MNNTAEIGIVGAGGCSGLAVLRALTEMGLTDVIGLESADSVGGIYGQAWLPSRFRLQTPKSHSLLFNDVSYEQGCGVYPLKAEVQGYLKKSLQTFKLEKYIHFKQRVIRTQYNEDKPYPWQVVCSDRQGQSNTYYFKYLVVASGRFSKPRWPNLLPKQIHFAEENVKFCTDYRETDAYSGKRVLVVGLGNSGQDIVLDLVHKGAKVSISQRGPINIGPDFMFRIGNKQFMTGFMFARMLQPLCFYGGKTGRLVADYLARTILKMYYPNQKKYGFKWDAMGPFSRNAKGLESRIPIVDEGIISAIRQKAVSKVFPEVLRYHEHQQVEFVDGSFNQFDEIIYCTGFVPDLDYLPEVVRQTYLPDGIPTASGQLGMAYQIGFMGMHFDLFGGIGRILPSNAKSLANAIKKDLICKQLLPRSCTTPVTQRHVEPI